MKVFLILILFSVSTIFASPSQDNILSLFKKFEEKADLSNETKRESIGHVIVFTRKDLDIMQAYTLADILRIIPVLNYAPNKFGVESLANPGEAIRISTRYRLYIDNHEVSSTRTYSPFLMYDRYPLDNIDHIEVYYSIGAISVFNEPSQVIIKLYTKKPDRENSTLVRLTGDTKKGYFSGFVTAKNLNENISYLVMLNQSLINFDEEKVHDQEISRDQLRRHFFFKLNYYDSILDISYSDVKRDLFFGISADGAPDEQKTTSNTTYISFSKSFLDDKSLKLTLSYDYQSIDINEKNKIVDGGIIYVPLLDVNNSQIITYLDEERNFHKYTIFLEKSCNTRKNQLLFGGFSRYYDQDLKEFNIIDGSMVKKSKENKFYIRSFRVNSVYIEDNYNINSNNLVTAGIRINSYKYSGSKSTIAKNFRFGYISYLTKNLMFKGFLTKSHILPSILEVEASNNHYLKEMDLWAASIEMEYKYKNHNFGFFTAHYEIKDLIKFDPSNLKIISTDESRTFNIYSFRYINDINPFNKLEVNYWFSDVNNTIHSPSSGGYIRLLTEFKKWQIYNELIYKSNFEAYSSKVDKSYNYNLAISYKFPYDWRLRIKGENLLNKGGDIPYTTYLGEKGTYRTNNRKIYITVEKLF